MFQSCRQYLGTSEPERVLVKGERSLLCILIGPNVAFAVPDHYHRLVSIRVLRDSYVPRTSESFCLKVPPQVSFCFLYSKKAVIVGKPYEKSHELFELLLALRKVHQWALYELIHGRIKYGIFRF